MQPIISCGSFSLSFRFTTRNGSNWSKHLSWCCFVWFICLNDYRNIYDPYCNWPLVEPWYMNSSIIQKLCLYRLFYSELTLMVTMWFWFGQVGLMLAGMGSSSLDVFRMVTKICIYSSALCHMSTLYQTVFLMWLICYYYKKLFLKTTAMIATSCRPWLFSLGQAPKPCWESSMHYMSLSCIQYLIYPDNKAMISQLWHYVVWDLHAQGSHVSLV